MRGDRFAGVLLSLVLCWLGSPLESASFIRGDANASGGLDISDGIRLLGHLFLGNPETLDCRDAADVDADGVLNIGDPIYLLNYLFTQGDAPEAPFPSCGASPVPGGLGCASFPICGQGQTSFELIDQALAAGEITSETALIYRVFHVFEDHRLPPAYRGAPNPSRDTQLVAGVLEVYGELSAEGRAVLDPFLVPPSAAGSWLDQQQLAGGAGGSISPSGAIEWQTIVSPSGKVKVWFQTRHAGDGAKAATIAGAVDGIWDQLVGLMNREPVPDGDVADPNGGDEKFDIYLVRIQSAGVTPVYRTAFHCSRPNPAYMLVDSRETTCLLPTVAHELMHALQWTYSGSPRCPSSPPFCWWMEASATWAEEYVFRKETNECQDATLLLSQPEVPLEFSGNPYDSFDLHPYAAYLWPYFLEVASGSADHVRTIWDRFPHSANALEAINASLPDGFQEWWPLFAVYNWNDHPQFNYRHDNFFLSASRADPATGLPRPEGETFTPVVLDGQADLHIPLFAEVEHLSSIYYHFTFPDDEVSYVAFEHFFDLQTAPTARVQAMVQMVGDPDYTYEDWTETPVKTFCREHADQRLDNLVIILTNSEWQNRSHVLDPVNPPVLYARNRCFSGGWSGTITNVNSLEEDILYRYPQDTFKIVRIRKTVEQRWDISPQVLGRRDSGCETFVVHEATWTGSRSVDEYVEDHERCQPGCTGTICIETSSHVDRLDSGPNPSGILFDRRCAETYHVTRPGGGSLGAPPTSFATKPTSTTHVQCNGTFVIPLPPLELREIGKGSPFIFDVTDPSRAQAFRGEIVQRDEGIPSGGEGLYVLSDTWSWNLVREPD
jgi:hypothetical protein